MAANNSSSEAATVPTPASSANSCSKGLVRTRNGVSSSSEARNSQTGRPGRARQLTQAATLASANKALSDVERPEA